MTTVTTSAPRLPGVDGVRACAAAIVCLGHYDMSWPSKGALSGVSLNEGLGPALFFVLSGALLMRSMLFEFGQSATVDLPRFFRRRAVRLLPAYVAFVLFDLLVSELRGNPWPIASILTAAAVAPNVYSMFADPMAPNPTSTLWSIGVAVQLLLLLVPIIAWILKRRGVSSVRLLLVAIALASAAARIAAGRSAADGVQALNYIYNSPLLRADGLAIGLLTGTFLPQSHADAPASPLTGKRVSDSVAALLLLVVIVGVVTPLSRSTMLFWISLPWAMCAAVLVHSVLSAEKGWLVRLFDAPLLSWIGRISYSILLVQWYAISLDRRLMIVPWPVRMLPVLATGVAAGWVLYTIMEAPFIRRLGRSA